MNATQEAKLLGTPISFNTFCRMRRWRLFGERADFHTFIGSGHMQPLAWWDAKLREFDRAKHQAEDARDERETMADALR